MTLEIQPNKPIVTPAEELKQDLDLWTTAKVKDEFFKCLSKVPNTDLFLSDRKYYAQAKELMHRIPVYDPSPAFIINISDLTPRIRKELQEFIEFNNAREINFLLKQIACKFFENIDHDYTHDSVLSHLKVRLEN